jgi:hypothetical protein
MRKVKIENQILEGKRQRKGQLERREPWWEHNFILEQLAYELVDWIVLPQGKYWEVHTVMNFLFHINLDKLKG